MAHSPAWRRHCRDRYSGRCHWGKVPAAAPAGSDSGGYLRRVPGPPHARPVAIPAAAMPRAAAARPAARMNEASRVIPTTSDTDAVVRQAHAAVENLQLRTIGTNIHRDLHQLTVARLADGRR